MSWLKLVAFLWHGVKVFCARLRPRHWPGRPLEVLALAVSLLMTSCVGRRCAGRLLQVVRVSFHKLGRLSGTRPELRSGALMSMGRPALCEILCSEPSPIVCHSSSFEHPSRRSQLASGVCRISGFALHLQEEAPFNFPCSTRVFAVVQQWDPDAILPLGPELQSELMLCAILQPLAVTNLRALVLPQVCATDASGGGRRR